MATQTADSKFTVEDINMEFDMLSRVRVGESIVTAIVTASVFAGIDLSPEDLISGDPSISNNVVTQKITGGTGGVIYLITCAARTSDNNIVVNEAKLAVLTSPGMEPPALP
jgi:hypothetical protein